MSNYVQIDVEVPTCPKCGSGSRTKYHHVRELKAVVIRGQYYEKISLRRTACLECGQNRVERVLIPPQDSSAQRTLTLDSDTTSQVNSAACTPKKTSKRKSPRSTSRSNQE